MLISVTCVCCAAFRKHGLDFADAWQIFDAPLLTALDTKDDYGEDRFLGIGFLRNFVVVVDAMTDEEIDTSDIPPLDEAFSRMPRYGCRKAKCRL